MKHLKAPFIGLAILCTILSCKKDVQQNASQNNQAQINTSNKLNAVVFDWSNNLSWNKLELPSRTVFYTNIKTGISSETAEQGIVRIFRTSNSNSQSLPFEETVNGKKYYWYYQVTAGNVMISVDAYGSNENPAATSRFKSVVLTKETVVNFETTGKSKTTLMTMPVESFTSNQ